MSDLANITGKASPRPLFDRMDAEYTYVDHDDESMLILTNQDAPMFKLIRISLSNGSVWDIVPENKQAVLESALSVAGNRLLLKYIEDVKHRIYIHELGTGYRLYSLPLKDGSVAEIVGNKASTEVFLSFESFTVPVIIYRIDLAATVNTDIPPLEEWRRTAVVGLDKDDFLVQQIFFESRDKTKVPMYIMSLKDTPRNGSSPTILDGYGGYGIPSLPSFSASDLMFVRHFKGVIALANIRGGGEYGEVWHRGGMRENKQNVFDDFIGAAEFLISNNYTNNRKLAIYGASNGGLLVATCAQQRPDLFGAVIGIVGVLDMLRFHKFTVGATWISEYGNPDDPKDFEFIHKYSPLHNIRFPKSGQWPSTLMMTADHDDRVVPSHTLKYAATLYEKAKMHPHQTNPLLFFVEENAGHGEGKPTWKAISEVAKVFIFLQRVLNIQWWD
ncbi:hypothetical protein Y032_0349g3207 [Ancylostoma ceylanicum]|nr:hypothetical protein Y032_0349g3207 [Ancylostoma ceylanicum]